MNAARNRHEISPRQVKAIHSAVKARGVDDPTYRQMLKTYGAHTCKELTWQQAEDLLDSLNGKSSLSTREKGQIEKSLHKGLQYADLDGRPGYASGSQCRLIAAMFSQVTRADAEDPAGREKALNSFCQRIAGVSALRMVRSHQVEKIVKALESMGAVKKEAK